MWYCLTKFLGVALGDGGDVSIVSAVHGDGSPWSWAADVDGVALVRARRLHERTYPELTGGDRARLIVLGCEVGGRWAQESLDLLRHLAKVKAREAPELLRRPASASWQRRWVVFLSVAAQTAVCESLLCPGSGHLTVFAGEVPALGEVLVQY